MNRNAHALWAIEVRAAARTLKRRPDQIDSRRPGPVGP